MHSKDAMKAMNPCKSIQIQSINMQASNTNATSTMLANPKAFQLFNVQCIRILPDFGPEAPLASEGPAVLEERSRLQLHLCSKENASRYINPYKSL